MRTVRYTGELKRHIDEIVHLLGFVEPVYLIEEYNRLSIYPSVRPVVDMKIVCH